MRHLSRILAWTAYLVALVAIFSTGPGCAGIKIPPLDCRTLGCPQDQRCVQASSTAGYVCEQIQPPPAPGPVCPLPGQGEDPSKWCGCWERSGRTDGEWKYTGDCPTPPPPHPVCPTCEAGYHCDDPAVGCVKDPEPPPPPPLECDVASIPVSDVVVNIKVYGTRTKRTGEIIHNYDATVKVKSAAWCAAHGMAEWGAVCPMAPEGDKCRNVRERYALAPGICPRFVAVSCDPTGNPSACPITFDTLIGNNMHPINAGADCPKQPAENMEQVEGFWAEPSGHGVIAACLWMNGPDGKPLGCGNRQAVNQ